jgi:hypothetical protein
MLEVHEMENARRSNNPRAFKNVRGNTHATSTTLPQWRYAPASSLPMARLPSAGSPRNCPIAIDPTALETNAAALPREQMLLKKAHGKVAACRYAL